MLRVCEHLGVLSDIFVLSFPLFYKTKIKKLFVEFRFVAYFTRFATTQNQHIFRVVAYFSRFARSRSKEFLF